MSRQNKKSRMKFLPPKIQLDERMATTGSYPTVSRLSVDGRTGNYPVSFDDTKTIVFGKKESIKDYIQYYLRAEEELYTTPDYYFAPSYAKGYSRSLENQLLAIHNGTVGAIPAQTSFEGNGRTLNYAASNTYTKIEDTTGLNLFNTFAGGNDRPFSISVRVRTNSTEALFKTVARVVDETTAYSQWTLAYNPSVQMILFTLQGVGSISCLSFGGFSPFFSVGSEFWIHATYDGSRTPQGINIYVTELFTGTTISLLNNNKTGAVNMGANPANSGFLLIGKGSTAAGTSWNGEISQFCLFNKVLSKDDFQNLVNQGFKSYVAQGSPLAGIDFGVGLDTASSYLGNTSALRENESSKDFTGTGNIIKGIGDATPMVHFTQGQEGGPFRDNDQYAVDGKSSNSDFYSTGTPISVTGEEGFDAPLWSKDKIEIDISCNSTVALPFVVSGCYVGSTNNEGDRPPSTTEGKSYPMAYYNFAAKNWEGIGTGAAHGTTAGSTALESPYTDFYYQGFAPGIINFPGYATQFGASNFRSVITGAFEFQASAGQPVSNFGFPHHPKYHASGSQTFKMSDVIDGPFVLEKIVVQMSASYDVSSTVYNTSTFRGYSGETTTEITEVCIPASISSFFVACQRKNAKVSYRERMEQLRPSQTSSDRHYTTNIPYNIVLSQNGSETYVNTIRDLLTWGNVTSYTNQILITATRVGNTAIGDFGLTPKTDLPLRLLVRDVNIQTGAGNNANISSVSWTSSLKMELPIKALARIDRNDIEDSYPNDSNMFGIMTMGSGSRVGIFDLKNSNGGFNNLGVLYPPGRNLRSSVRDINFQSNYDSGLLSFKKEVVLVEPQDRYVASPYILQPSDELIIGWQQPIPIGCHASLTAVDANNPRDMSPGTLSTTTFPQGPAKLVLYGSYLSGGKPKNDSLNQLLSSDSVHEVIGED